MNPICADAERLKAYKSSLNCYENTITVSTNMTTRDQMEVMATLYTMDCVEGLYLLQRKTKRIAYY